MLQYKVCYNIIRFDHGEFSVQHPSCFISPYKSPSVLDTLTYSIGTSRQVSHALAEVKCILA